MRRLGLNVERTRWYVSILYPIATQPLDARCIFELAAKWLQAEKHHISEALPSH